MFSFVIAPVPVVFFGRSRRATQWPAVFARGAARYQFLQAGKKGPAGGEEKRPGSDAVKDCHRNSCARGLRDAGAIRRRGHCADKIRGRTPAIQACGG